MNKLVRFRKSWKGYKAGETAAFAENDVNDLLRSKIADLVNEESDALADRRVRWTSTKVIEKAGNKKRRSRLEQPNELGTGN